MDINQIQKEELMKEAAYAGNIGFQEMVEFYQQATEMQIKKMEALVKKNNWKGVKALFKAILGVDIVMDDCETCSGYGELEVEDD